MRTKVLGIAVSMAIALSSCKKNACDEQASISNDPANFKAKAWFEKQSKTPPTALRSNTETLSFSGEVQQWERGKFFPESKTSLIPVDLGRKSMAAPKVSKFLLVEEGADGTIKDGYYCYILTKNTLSDITPAFLAGDVPDHFAGAILRYRLDGTLIGSSHYANGEATGVQDKIIRKQRSYESKGDPGSQNIVPLDEGCQYVTIDWYWQGYVNGVLIYEEYLFSSTEVICEGGGGGPSQGSTCAQQANDFLNAGQAVSILQSMETDISADSLRCILRPNWKIYSAGTWFIYSYETITWARASKNEAYVFSSYVSRGDAALGTSVGGTRSYTIISKTAIPVGAAGTSVIIEIDFTVKNQVVCNAVPIDPVILGARSNMRFKAPATVIYEN